MRPTPNNRAPGHRQRGAALIVGLVLMMVLTILAISTMRTSTLELSMAGNTQYREKARQLAEAGIADAMDQIDNGLVPLSATNPGIWNNGIIVGNLEPATGDIYRVDIRFLNVGDPPAGGSQGREDLQANFFELQATGTTAARNARSILRRGFYIFAE
jgi:type IV pilus assembly protein PilX